MALVLFALAIVGCSTTEPVEEPAPLPDITETVTLEEAWDCSIGDGMDGQLLFLQPSVDEQALYAVDTWGELYAKNPQNGETLWERDLDERILAGVGRDAQQLYVANEDGEVIALSREDGSERWRAPLPSEVLAPPQSNGRQVVVQTIDGKVIGFAQSDGERLWQYDSIVPVLSFRGTGTPYVDSQTALIGLANGRLVALDVTEGSQLWQYEVGVPEGRTELERLVDVDANPVVEDGVVYIAGYQGKLAALELRSGQELWSREGSSLQSPSLGGGEIFLAKANGTLIGLDAYSHTEAWRVDALSWRRLTRPLPVADVVLVGDFEGYLHILSQQDGAFLGRVQVDDEGLRVPPVRVGNLIYVFGNSGELVAYKVPRE
ncbi:outer membrane protein assembly factor BamB [Marinobacteraceae bacterium S3BR75-40.1]